MSAAWAAAEKCSPDQQPFSTYKRQLATEKIPYSRQLNIKKIISWIYN